MITLLKDESHLNRVDGAPGFNVCACDFHQLQRSSELKQRTICSQCVAHNPLFRMEMCWSGFYYSGHDLMLDDENRHVLTKSRRDSQSGEWQMEKMPVYRIFD